MKEFGLGDDVRIGIVFQAFGQSFIVKPLHESAVQKSVTYLEKNIGESNLE